LLLQTSWWFEGELAAEIGTALPVDLDVGSVDALQGLEQLQVLDLDIVCLDRHAAYPSLTCLPCLCELQLEMCGTLKRSRHISAGLPHLPHLTKLLLYTKVSTGFLSTGCCVESFICGVIFAEGVTVGQTFAGSQDSFIHSSIA